MKQAYTKLSFSDQLKVIRAAYYGYTYNQIRGKYHIGNSTISFILSPDNLLGTIRNMEWRERESADELQAQQTLNLFLGTLCIALTMLSAVALYF